MGEAKPQAQTTPGEVQQKDKDSGLVEREIKRERTPRGKLLPGKLTERTLEGQQVEATWQDRQGQVQHAAGKVIRDDAGQLAIESWADGVRQEATVTRDANVDVLPRLPRSR